MTNYIKLINGEITMEEWRNSPTEEVVEERTIEFDSQEEYEKFFDMS